VPGDCAAIALHHIRKYLTPPPPPPLRPLLGLALSFWLDAGLDTEPLETLLLSVPHLRAPVADLVLCAQTAGILAPLRFSPTFYLRMAEVQVTGNSSGGLTGGSTGGSTGSSTGGSTGSGGAHGHSGGGSSGSGAHGHSGTHHGHSGAGSGGDSAEWKGVTAGRLWGEIWANLAKGSRGSGAAKVPVAAIARATHHMAHLANNSMGGDLASATAASGHHKPPAISAAQKLLAGGAPGLKAGSQSLPVRGRSGSRQSSSSLVGVDGGSTTNSGSSIGSGGGGGGNTHPGGDQDAHGAESSLTVFSCGHVYTRRALVDELLPKLSAGMRALPRGLALTTEVLLQEYRRPKITAACPACVFNSFREDVVGKDPAAARKFKPWIVHQ
jgi:hypothetical protein